MTAANGITAVAQTPITIALIAKGLKAAPVTVAMKTNKTGMKGKADGAANTAAAVTVEVGRKVAVNTAADNDNMAAVNTAAAHSGDREVNIAVAKVIVPARKTIGITPMIAKADTAASSAVTTRALTTTPAVTTLTTMDVEARNVAGWIDWLTDLRPGLVMKKLNAGIAWTISVKGCVAKVQRVTDVLMNASEKTSTISWARVTSTPAKSRSR